MTTIEQLSQEFTKVITNWLTPDQVAEVNKRNATPAYEGMCGTHDFCDANQAMIDAWNIVCPGQDLFSEENWLIAGHAWNLSKTNQFK